MAVEKFVGRDCELSTTGADAAGQALDPWKVTGALLRQLGPALEAGGTQVWSRDARSRSNWGGGSGSA
jgi:hypothetical protein